MSNKKYINIDLEDERIKDLADVISNKTSKKIISYLVENEASESEIAYNLKLPANTVNYNIKKLVKSGLIEKSKDYWWSVKGKKILKYRIANKKIVISPKPFGSKGKAFVSLIFAGIVSIGIKFYTESKVDAVALGNTEKVSITAVAGESADFARAASDVVIEATSIISIPNVWIWFFIGAVFAIVVYMLLNLKKS